MKYIKILGIILSGLFLTYTYSNSAQFDYVNLASEVRQYDPSRYSYSANSIWYNGNPYWFMIAFSGTSGEEPIYPVYLDFPVYSESITDPYQLGDRPNYVTNTNFSDKAFFDLYDFASPGPVWEKNYTFFIDENGNGLRDAGEPSNDWLIPPNSIRKMDVLNNVKITGSIHPTISWDSVLNTDVQYMVRFYNLTDYGFVDLNVTLFSTGIITNNSFTYSGDIFKDGKEYAVWVQARELHPFPPYNWAFINRATYFTTHQANQPLIIDDFFVDPSYGGAAPLTVTFTCTAHHPDPNISIQGYEFDYGNGFGESSFTGIITYTYDDPGVYQPTCIAVDDEGGLSPPEVRTVVVRQPRLFGLFIGQDFLWDGLRADLNAIEISRNFANLKSVVYNKVVTHGDYEFLPITDSQIDTQINDICEVIQPGDIFVLYISGHGFESQIFGKDETPPLTPGDEYILLSDLLNSDWYFLTDDELTSYLSCMDDSIQKWILVDACHSGGFWGNKNPNDEGDLEKLKNISMIASVAEEKTSHYVSEPTHQDFGKTLFACGLREALHKENNYVRADNNPRNGVLTFDELVHWLKLASPAFRGEFDGIIVEKAGSDDSLIFFSDMWKPVDEKSDDFIGNLLTDSPDTPSANANGPYSGLIHSPITFDASGSNTPNGSIVLYEWDWDNDGVYDESTGSTIITHTWNKVFSGTITLRVTDNKGMSEIDSASVTVVPEIIAINIDIKPGSDSNCINVSKKGLTPVAILSTSNLDLSSINVNTIEIDDDNDPATSGIFCAKSSFKKDVNGDSVPDCVLHFSTPALDNAGILVDSNLLYITGTLFDGTAILGLDVIHIARESTICN